MYCSFNQTWTSMDLGLTMLHKTVSDVKPKRQTVDIPFRNGSIDLLPMMSANPVFENRTLTMTFEIMVGRSSWASTYADLCSKIAGKEVDVIVTDDINYMFRGMCTVGALKDKTSTAELTITVDSFPYKLKAIATNLETAFEYVASTGDTKTINVGSNPVFFENAAIRMTSGTIGRVRVVIDDTITLIDYIYGGDSPSVKGLMLPAGTHTFKCTIFATSETATIDLLTSWRGGVL